MTAKEEIMETVKSQPADSTYEEIMHNLAYKQVIAKGLEDSLNGRVISHEELKEEVKSW